MVEMLFLEDSYLKECRAKVVSVTDKFIVLDKTVFYPRSGGQSSDTGTITRLSDNKAFQLVQATKQDGEIFHEVSEAGIKQGDEVLCRIDWQRRYKLMRLHTAAHLLDAVFQRDGEVLITGNELTVEKARIDFNLKDATKEKMQQYVDKANELIQNDVEVKNYSLPREGAMKIPGIVKLAKAAPPDLPVLRITEIVGIDVQADAGTHVKSLKEVGKIVFLGMENKGKDRKRIYFDVV